MSFFKNLFKTPKKEEPISNDLKLDKLPLDEIFVENFIKNQGKFLYSTSLDEITSNLANIVKENAWDTIICDDSDLQKLITPVDVKTTDIISAKHPLFTSCEHLIAENGSILLSSNQVKEFKIPELSDNFIIYATTSQLVASKGESLTGIKTRYKENIPSSISAIKNFNPNSKTEDFMSYGNTNSKNLYLLLFEDL